MAKSLSYQLFSHGLRLSRTPRIRAQKIQADRSSTSKCHPTRLNWLRYCWP